MIIKNRHGLYKKQRKSSKIKKGTFNSTLGVPSHINPYFLNPNRNYLLDFLEV